MKHAVREAILEKNAIKNVIARIMLLVELTQENVCVNVAGMVLIVTRHVEKESLASTAIKIVLNV